MQFESVSSRSALSAMSENEVGGTEDNGRARKTPEGREARASAVIMAIEYERTEKQRLVLQCHLISGQSFSQQIISVAKDFAFYKHLIATQSGAKGLPRISGTEVLGTETACGAAWREQSLDEEPPFV